MKRVFLLITLIVSTFIYGCCGCAKEKKAMSAYDEEFTPQAASTTHVNSIREDFFYNY
jgi:hypothetical protein